jgi:hypothetical protein
MVQISARRGTLMLSRPVELMSSSLVPGLIVTPDEVELLLNGPLDTLREVEVNPELIRVIVEVQEVASGESLEQLPQVIAPEGIRAQLVPPKVMLSRR